MVSTIGPTSTASAVSELDQALAELRNNLVGALYTAADDGYGDVRQTIYFEMDRYPLAVVRVAAEQDVVAAIRFARANNVQLAIRSGGHSLAHYSVIDDAIIVDFSEYKQVRIDPVARIARVQGGATSNDVAWPANEHGLALTTGDTQSVGIGGLTTGGGIGYMVRKYGLTIDSLLSARVATADGQIVTASAVEHPELFWAIRGGGGNFGIITEFTFRLAPVDKILGGNIVLPASREVIRGYLDYVTAAPEELSTIGNLMHAPPAPFIPEDRVGEMVLEILVVWTGDPEEGERAVAPLRALATPVADTLDVIPYPGIYKFTEHLTLPHAASIRQMFAYEISDDVIDASLDAIRNASSPFSLVHMRGLGGAMSRVDKFATAFSHRDTNYFFAVIAAWLDPAEDGDKHRAWTEELWAKVRGEGSGVYVNFLEKEGPERIKEAYGAVTWERLRAIKAHYDPDNLFHFNQNIPPRGK